MGRMVKIKNKRVFACIAKSENEDAVYIQFKRLIPKEDIEEFKRIKTCRMILKKNIVITEMSISKQAAYELSALLIKVLKEDYEINKNDMDK